MPETTENPSAQAAPPLTGVTPYLSLDGALKAAAFYVSAFGARQVGAAPPDEKGRTMHVYLVLNGGPLMLSDFFPEHGYPPVAPQGYTLHLQVDDVEAWWSRAIAAGASAVTAPHDAFWGDRYAQLRDPWGVTWGLGMTPGKEA